MHGYISAFLLYLLIEVRAQSSSISIPPWPVQTFVSNPNISTPVVNINKTGTTAPGYLFFAPDGSSHPNNTAPVIKTDADELIWYGPKGHAFGFSPQTYNDEPVLAYWTGQIYPEPVGLGYGNVIVLNGSYDLVANVTLEGNFITHNTSAPLSSFIDLHEPYITVRNTLLVSANNITTYDLTPYGGSKQGYIVDCQIYELNLTTSEVIFTWSALDHLSSIPMDATYYKYGTEGFNGTSPATAWNYFHINSVALSPDGESYIISSRYTCSTVLVSRSTGSVEWILQGQDPTHNRTAEISSFNLASNSSFCYQHDVRLYPSPNNNTSELLMSMHDNANSPLTLPNPTIPSSGLLLSLNLTSKTATALTRYQPSSSPIYATALGSYQPILPSTPFSTSWYDWPPPSTTPTTNSSAPDNPSNPPLYPRNAHVILNHGFTPIILEFAPDDPSVPIMTAQYGPITNGLGVPQGGVISYRGYKAAWVGCPNAPPSVVAVRQNSSVEVYVSWNGATEVAEWEVYVGVNATSLSSVGVYEKMGFETKVELSSDEMGGEGVVQVRARGNGEGRCGDLEAAGRSAVIAV